jgi:hypothetical protein
MSKRLEMLEQVLAKGSTDPFHHSAHLGLRPRPGRGAHRCAAPRCVRGPSPACPFTADVESP